MPEATEIEEIKLERPHVAEDKPIQVKWYRSVFYNATVLGLCSFAAPGLWVAMNSLGAGGGQSPYLVNTANALTFCLMVVSCWLTSGIVRYIGIKGALFVGTIGYAPYSAGLYLNNRYGVEWLVIAGAAICGISAGVFWASEAAIAIAYPEPHNRGRMVAYWLTYTRLGQIVVYLVFIGIQASGILVSLFLNRPSHVQRPNGTPVELTIVDNPWQEFKATTKSFFTKKFLFLVLWLGQGMYAEPVVFTYNALWFSVRARALGSFLSAIVSVICGNLLGLWLDQHQISLRKRTRWAFALIMILQGAWWLWLTINVTEYRQTQPLFDWTDPGFGRAFGVFVFLMLGFQLNYNFSYFVIDQISTGPQETIRFAALLRGTQSAWQAVGYGLNAIPIIASVGGPYINFGLWGVSIIPAWLVIKDFGTGEEKDDVVNRIETRGGEIRKG